MVSNNFSIQPKLQFILSCSKVNAINEIKSTIYIFYLHNIERFFLAFSYCCSSYLHHYNILYYIIYFNLTFIYYKHLKYNFECYIITSKLFEMLDLATFYYTLRINYTHNVYTVFSLKIIYLYILMLNSDTNKWNLGR